MENKDMENKRLCLGCMEKYDGGQDICPFCGYDNKTRPAEAIHLTPGTVLQNKYIVGKAMGYGGFSVTYLGYDTTLQIKIAIKEYLPSEHSTRVPKETTVTISNMESRDKFLEGINKFVQEAQRIAGLDNIEGVVKVYNTFTENNTAYIVMEYLEGETLASKLKKDGRIEPSKALEMLMPLLDSLEKVHKVGVLHRDISPDNIFYTKDEKIKLIDFGAARYAPQERSQSLSVFIKPGYTPAEQYTTKGDQGTWTDVYSLAATIYKMITGITPPDGLDRKLKDTLKPPTKTGIKLSKNAETAILNAMNVNIGSRTRTVAEFREQLYSTKEVKRITEKTEKKDTGKIPKWLIAAGAVAACAAIAFGVMLGMGVFTKPEPEPPKIAKNQTRVPYFINQKQAAAEQNASQHNVSVDCTDSRINNDVPVGTVYEQNISEGSVVKKGTTVILTISAGKEQVVVPNLEGLSEEKAMELLKESGLKGTVTGKVRGSIYEAGMVCSQDIEAESSVDKGTEIGIMIAEDEPEASDSSAEEEKVTMPDFKDQDIEQIKKTAEKAGLKLRIVYDRTTEVPEGKVHKQSVTPGKEVDKGSTVTITINQGQPKASVPYLLYKTKEDAEKVLKDNHLKYEYDGEEFSDIPKGHVSSQDPEEATVVERDTVVKVRVSKGPYSAKLQQIYLTTPSRVTFDQGEAFDTTGLEVYAKYEDGKTTLLSDTAYTISQPDMSTPGTKEITITYKTVSTKYEIEVRKVQTSQQSKPQPSPSKKLTGLRVSETKTFKVGETFTKQGLTVTAKFSDGSSRTLSDSEYSVSSPDMSKAGTKKLTVTYQGRSLTVNVTVVEDKTKQKILTGLSVSSSRKYYTGSTVSKDDISVTAKYSDGSVRKLSSGEFSISAPDMSTSGKKAVRITYKNKQIDLTINVYEKTVTSVSVATNPKLTYNKGEAFSKNGLTLKVKYNDGSSRTVGANDISISGYDSNKVGSYDITASYKGKSVKLRVTVKETVIASGKCGGNVRFTLDKDGTLTITGSGSMYGYAAVSGTSAPWSSHRSSIKKLVVKSGVGSIGAEAFQDCTALKSAELPGSLDSIGNSAFKNCSSLTSVSIPSGVRSIGNSAFSSCKALGSISLPSSLDSIGSSAFSRCTGCSTLTIPSGVSACGGMAFNGWKSNQTIILSGRSSIPSGGKWAGWKTGCNAKIKTG